MPNLHKSDLLAELHRQFGAMHKLDGSNSLFSIGEDAARVYLRYSKVHSDGRTFYGLRAHDLRQLEGRNAFICFFADDHAPPLFVPYQDFEGIFAQAAVAADGQYKVQVISEPATRDLYIPRLGKFNERLRRVRSSFAPNRSVPATPVRSA